MQTTYRLNTQELSMAFITSLKSLLPDQDIEIVVSTLPKNGSIDEYVWLHAASSSPSFDFLKEDDEDIYTLKDGIAPGNEE